MSIDRRKFIGWVAAGAATGIAGCGGGGGHYVPTRSVWLLNLNPEYPALDASFGGITVSSGLPFQALTQRFEVEYGRYTVALYNWSTQLTEFFDNVVIDSQSPSLFVFYRHFNSTWLGSSPAGIANYFDSNVGLDVDLFGPPGLVQQERLAFEGEAPQRLSSSQCTLQLYAANSQVLVYDSGLQLRTDSILVFPRFPAFHPRSGEVAVVGLNYDGVGAAAVSWPNLLG